MPSTKDLGRAADLLQKTGSCITTKRLALYSQWARLDERFAQILVSYLKQNWRHIAHVELLAELQKQVWPRAILVPLRFVAIELKGGEKKLLQTLIAWLEKNLPPFAAQMFFIPLQRPIASILKREVELASTPYTQSGFIGSQSLLSRSRWPKGITVLQSHLRRQRLEDLLEQTPERPIISVADYMRACQGMVSVRQAQRDLKAATKTLKFRLRRSRRKRAQDSK